MGVKYRSNSLVSKFVLQSEIAAEKVKFYDKWHYLHSPIPWYHELYNPKNNILIDIIIFSILQWEIIVFLYQ
jgi:hypothetical protein